MNVESVNIGDNYGARFRLMKNKYNDINSIYNYIYNKLFKKYYFLFIFNNINYNYI